MMRESHVSVVVPVRDGARYLEAALHSIAGQTRPPREVIVVDDGSRDESAQIAARFGARVERQAPTGQAAARNRGVAVSTGDFVAFLDADDLWAPGKLEHQMAALRLHPDVDLLFGHVRQFVSPELASGSEVPARRVDEPRPAHLFGSLLARRRALDRVGPFSTEWRVGELMDWLLRARDAGVTELMTRHLVLYRRLHASNISHVHESRVDHVRILRRTLDRRRGRIGG